MSQEPTQGVATSDAAEETGAHSRSDEPRVAGEAAAGDGCAIEVGTPGDVEAEAATPASGEQKTPDSDEGSAAPAKAASKPRPKLRDPAVARAFRSGRPVQGRILGVIKGGYEVRVGRSRAFCPHSQIDLHRVDEAEQLVGKTYQFKVSQFRRGGEDIVLSRRALLEEDQADEAKAVRAALLEGQVVDGKVSGIADFGAFVDLGAGVMGLIHVSELSHGRVARVSDAVKPGDTVRVKILKLHDSGKISLSIRRATDDPWAGVGERFAAGRVYPGKLLRLADFGAFVELSPGVEALAPAREFPPKAGGWREGLEPGEETPWLVLSVDPKRRRISITPAPEDAAAIDRKIEPGVTIHGKVQNVERFGVFVWLAPGHVGLMPNVWCGEKRGADLTRRFPVGSEVEVEVVEVSDEGRRIRLARKGAYRPEAQPRPAPASRRQRGDTGERSSDGAPPPSFGNNLGDLLRAALDRRDR